MCPSVRLVEIETVLNYALSREKFFSLINKLTSRLAYTCDIPKTNAHRKLSLLNVRASSVLECVPQSLCEL